MNILGIDYGKAKIGLAISHNLLAEPLKVVRYSSLEEFIKKLEEIIKKESIQKIVVGISEGETKRQTEEFVTFLKEKINTPIETFDETLSTHEAQELSKEVGMKRKKRRQMEDAYAATIILQRYIDRN